MITFAQISDTHIGPSPQYEFHDVRPYDNLQRFVDHFVAQPQLAQWVLHTGDLVQDRSADSMRVAKSLLDRLPVPYILVNGNHDSAQAMVDVFDVPHQHYADKPVSIDAVYPDARTLVLDTWHESVRDPLGFVSTEQCRWLDATLAACDDSHQWLVAMHHAPFPIGSPWMDANMVITNAADLHAVLVRHRHKVAVVVHGHLHRGMSVERDGIGYRGLPSLAWQYDWRPHLPSPQVDRAWPPTYGLIGLADTGVQIIEYALCDRPST